MPTMVTLMPTNIIIGEFEQMVLLTLLRLGDDAYALSAREHLGGVIGRPVSRGALYRTLDRLEKKGYLGWELEEEVPERGGHPRRRFEVTPDGIRALTASRSSLLELWSGLEEVLR